MYALTGSPNVDPGHPEAAGGRIGVLVGPDGLPVVTYGGGMQQIRLNGETIDLISVPSSHTRGDTIVRFENADVMLIGDFYRNYGYPFVDTLHGGSISGILQAIDLVTSLAGPNTHLVPGHGGIATVADRPPDRDMVVAVQTSIQQTVHSVATRSGHGAIAAGTQRREARHAATCQRMRTLWHHNG